MIGPVFFRLIQTSVNYGFKKALFFALGVSSSDWVYALLAYFGLSSLLENVTIVFWMGKIGGAVLMVLGLTSLYSAFKKDKPGFQIKNKKNFLSTSTYLQGFLINIFSPLVIFFWVAIVTLGRVKFSISENELIYYLGGALTTILVMDVLKSFLADKIRNLLTPRFISVMNGVVGAALLSFGISLLFVKLNDISTEEMMDKISLVTRLSKTLI